MDYVKLGRTGLDVSRICLGCMSYGDAARGGHPWALDEEAPRPFFQQALDAGINFFDTANVYSVGTSEEFLGRAIATSARPRRGGDRDQGARPDAPGPEQHRAVAEGDPRRGRPQPAPARHRLHRPVPDPPARPAHADGGDARGAARRREGGQGAVPRRVVDVGVAVRQGAAPRRGARLDEVRVHAGPLQPPQPGRGARDAAALRGPGRRRDPVEPAGAGPPGPPVGRGHRALGAATRSGRRCTTRRPTG